MSKNGCKWEQLIYVSLKAVVSFLLFYAPFSFYIFVLFLHICLIRFETDIYIYEYMTNQNSPDTQYNQVSMPIHTF